MWYDVCGLTCDVVTYEKSEERERERERERGIPAPHSVSPDYALEVRGSDLQVEQNFSESLRMSRFSWTNIVQEEIC